MVFNKVHDEHNQYEVEKLEGVLFPDLTQLGPLKSHKRNLGKRCMWEKLHRTLGDDFPNVQLVFQNWEAFEAVFGLMLPILSQICHIFSRVFDILLS